MFSPQISEFLVIQRNGNALFKNRAVWCFLVKMDWRPRGLLVCKLPLKLNQIQLGICKILCPSLLSNWPEWVSSVVRLFQVNSAWGLVYTLTQKCITRSFTFFLVCCFSISRLWVLKCFFSSQGFDFALYARATDFKVSLWCLL